MEFDKVIETRKSVRSFRSKKAKWEDVLEAVDTARKSPFAGNQNYMKFIIIEKQTTIDRIAELANQLWINESGILVVVCSDDTHLENMYGERGRVYSRQQSGAAIENFLLKIADMGLSACWVGAYQDELIKQLLKIPEHMQLEAIIPIGYEKKKEERKEKKSLESVMFWEYWDNSKRPSLFQEDKDQFGSEG